MTTTTTELDTLYDLVDEIEIAMLTTKRPDGHLESRAMATQKRASGADLWFVAADGSRKLADIEADPHVNLAYYDGKSREWVSVSGLATLSKDRAKIRSSTPKTGRSGSRTPATRATGRPTTRDSS